jgi:hypothetical protein
MRSFLGIRDLVTRGTIVAIAALGIACGARTDPGGGRRDGSVEDDASLADASSSSDAVSDVRGDRAPPRDGAACCASILLNESRLPGACVQAASFLVFAVEATCSAPVQRIDVHTSAKQLAVLADGGAKPGAVLVPPTATFSSEPGWTSIAPTGLVLEQGRRYYVAIGGSGTPCDYADQGDPVEYWGNFDGAFQKFDGPFYAPYVARVIAACK